MLILPIECFSNLSTISPQESQNKEPPAIMTDGPTIKEMVTLPRAAIAHSASKMQLDTLLHFHYAPDFPVVNKRRKYAYRIE